MGEPGVSSAARAGPARTGGRGSTLAPKDYKDDDEPHVDEGDGAMHGAPRSAPSTPTGDTSQGRVRRGRPRRSTGGGDRARAASTARTKGGAGGWLSLPTPIYQGCVRLAPAEGAGRLRPRDPLRGIPRGTRQPDRQLRPHVRPDPGRETRARTQRSQRLPPHQTATASRRRHSRTPHAVAATKRRRPTRSNRTDITGHHAGG